MRRRGFTLVELMIVVMIIAILIAMAVGNMIESKKAGNEAGAIQTLRAIQVAQEIHKNSGKDGVGDNYASLGDLSAANLLDDVFGSSNLTTPFLGGVTGSARRGPYIFVAEPSPGATNFVWVGYATPTLYQQSGDRYFVTSQQGVIAYRRNPIFVLNDPDPGVDVTTGALILTGNWILTGTK